MLPEIFRLLWWTLIHRKRQAAARKAAKTRAARKKAHRKTAAKKPAAPSPRSGRVHHPRKAASPKPATQAA